MKMTNNSCGCGYQASSPEDLTDHLAETLIPDDDTAPDGQVHAEAARDEPHIGGILACLCGFTGTASELDEHFLRALAPRDMTGRDDQVHRLASQDAVPPADGNGDQSPASTASL
jgi:hypothetical protein